MKKMSSLPLSTVVSQSCRTCAKKTKHWSLHWLTRKTASNCIWHSCACCNDASTTAQQSSVVFLCHERLNNGTTLLEAHGCDRLDQLIRSQSSEAEIDEEVVRVLFEEREKAERLEEETKSLKMEAASMKQVQWCMYS